jgi:fumarate reductase flavoprotein subunit
MMGGIHTDIHGKTPLEGLYAAGEAACVSINGANRLGSNSLTELLVFGARAGREAAQYALEQAAPAANPLAQLLSDEQRRIEEGFLRKTGGRERIATLREEMQKAMEQGAGIYRHEADMRQTCDILRKLRERFTNIALDDHSRVFNTELTAALELDFMLDVAETVAHSALQRRESRGSHTRTDFPTRDDEHFLQHSLAYYTPEGPRIDYLPVTLTRWPPEERKY